MARRVAFFDVDQTLVTQVSIFRFLAYDVAARGLRPAVSQEVIDGLRRLKAAGGTREDANRAFYRAFAGRSVEELSARGERWFRAERAGGGLFDPRLLTMLRAHALAGDLTVLLSGSFPPCLTPIAQFLGADIVVCTQPEIEAGRYTGRVDTPMVGRHKADAARVLAHELGIALADCFGYGDDASDLALLETVGHPVVVGDDAELGALVRSRGCHRIPALGQAHSVMTSSRTPGWSTADSPAPPATR